MHHHSSIPHRPGQSLISRSCFCDLNGSINYFIRIVKHKHIGVTKTRRQVRGSGNQLLDTVFLVQATSLSPRLL